MLIHSWNATHSCKCAFLSLHLSKTDVLLLRLSSCNAKAWTCCYEWWFKTCRQSSQGRDSHDVTGNQYIFPSYMLVYPNKIFKSHSFRESWFLFRLPPGKRQTGTARGRMFEWLFVCFLYSSNQHIVDLRLYPLVITTAAAELTWGF